MANVYPLKELCLKEITDGTHKTPTYSDSGYIFLSSKNVTTEKIDWENVAYIPETLHNELYNRLSPQRDDILLAKNGTTGVAAIVDRDEIFDIYVSLALIRPNPDVVVPQYLLYAINSDSSKRYFDSHLKGIGVPNLHLTHIRETPIRLPNKKIQLQIVSLFDKFRDLISLRKQQLAKLDELVKVRFVEMFGDPITNSKCLATRELIQIITLQRGYDLPVQSRDSNGNIPVYGSNGVLDYHSQSKSTCGVITGRSGTIGKVYYCKEKFWPLNTTLFSIETYGNNIIYLAHLLEYYRLDRFHDGTGVPTLNRNVIHHQPIIDVPVSQQENFAAFVEGVSGQKLTIQQSLDKLEVLKKKLMQEYFG